MDGELTVSAAPCSVCKNHIGGTFNCKAFPKRIPDKILLGENDHTQPFPSDSGIQFEPIKKETQKSWDLNITKTDDDQRLVFGWLSVAKDAAGNEVVDLQGDIIDPDELEKAAYDYVLHSREAGDSHKRYEGIGKIVTSIVTTREIQKAMGIPEGIVPEGWFVGYHIDDQKVWKAIKSGEYQSFSIGGIGKRIPLVEKHLSGKHDQKNHGRGGGINMGGKVDTDSKEFKEWFGDSQVINENSEPLKMYHGSEREFNEFDPDKTEGMIWLTENKNYAYEFSGKNEPKELYVKVENPFNMRRMKGERNLPEWQETFEDMGIDTSGMDFEKLDWAPNYGKYTFFDLLPHAGNNYLNAGTLDAIKDAGFDGILAPPETNNGITSKNTIVAFKPNQIKSTKNRGTFDQNSNNIYE